MFTTWWLVYSKINKRTIFIQGKNQTYHAQLPHPFIFLKCHSNSNTVWTRKTNQFGIQITDMCPIELSFNLYFGCFLQSFSSFADTFVTPSLAAIFFHILQALPGSTVGLGPTWKSSSSRHLLPANPSESTFKTKQSPRQTGTLNPLCTMYGPNT